MTDQEALAALYGEAAADQEADSHIVVPLNDAQLTESLKRIRELRDRKDVIAAEEKKINQELEDLQKSVVPAFEVRGASSMKFPGVGQFILTSKLRPRVIDIDGLTEWLDEEGEGSIAKRTINHNTFASWWKERVENGDTLPPETFAEAFNQKSITVRKA